MNVKCQVCKKILDKNEAFCIKTGKVNKYYCNEEEYKQVEKNKTLKNDTYKKIFECFGRQITNSILFKEINELNDIYGYECILGYIESNFDYIYNVLQEKDFTSEYAKIRYFSAILKNSLADYIPEKNEYEKCLNIDIDIEESKYKTRKRKRSLEEIEEEVGEEL